jgi:hypothetical protein
MRYGAALMLLLALSMQQSSGQTPAPGAGERKSVDLTIYNQNLALVREERFFTFQRGISRIVVPDIPATIDRTSVHFLSLSDPRGVSVVEQNYQYDLVHQAKLLERYLGKTVEWVRTSPDGKTEYTVSGRLLSTGYVVQPGYNGVPNYNYGGGMVAEVDGKIEINPAGRLVLPSLPEGLILRPQLEWLVNATREGGHRAEVSYLAGALSWNCNYVVLLGKEGAKLDLTGWVTLVNNSGTTFRDAGLKLVAGDVNIVRDRMERALGAAKTTVDAAEMQEQFKQTDLFEYKLYTLQRRTDLKNNETKQIELTSARDAASKKVFIYDGVGEQWRFWHRNSYAYRSQGSFGQESNPKVGVFVTFRNDERSGLGLPLPKGKVRVYQRDQDGKEQFVGEDEIDHTPKDEEVRLYLGNAFDIVGERAQKDFRSLAGGRIVEETFEIKVRNHKTEPVEVLVYEHPWRWSQWEIVSASAEWAKVDQTTIKFPVRLKSDEQKTIRYTIRYSW